MRISRFVAGLMMLVMVLELFSLNGMNFSGARSVGTSPEVQPLVPSSLTLNVTLSGRGATFPQPLIANWTTEYHEDFPNTTITYPGGGSGAGQAAVLNKTVDFGASDAPLSTRQRALYPGILHIPETVGSVTLSYNIPIANGGGALIPRGGLNLTGAVVAAIYLGSITNWNDSAIRALNPGALKLLPNQTIKTVHRKDSSGTTFVFTSFLCLDSGTWCSQVGNGTSVPWPSGGVEAQGNGGVASYVNSTQYSLGYVELQYAAGGGLTYAKVQNPKGNFILPTLTSTGYAVSNSTSALPAASGDWSHVSMLNANGTLTYPIASFTYLLVYKEMNVVPSMDLNELAQFNALKSFLNWAITVGQRFAPGLNYVPLHPNVVALDQAGINSMTLTVISSPTPRSIPLKIGPSGWGGTQPGPQITVVSHDTVTITFNDTDGLSHQWYIDFNNNGVQDTNETNISFSFSGLGLHPYTFKPIIWNATSVPKAGTYVYRDNNNPNLSGSITILPQQVAAVLTSAAVDIGKPPATATVFLPIVDTSRVATVGSLIIDMRTLSASGNVTIASADIGTSTLSYSHSFAISNLQLGVVSGVSGLALRFCVNVLVTPYTLSSNILVQLATSTTTVPTTQKSLTRDLDINGDGTINILDMSIILGAYGTSIGNPGYNPAADLNGSGTINILGMGPFLANFGYKVYSN